MAPRGPPASELDFEWRYSKEPHTERRAAILQKHPEIKKLMLAHGDRRVAIQGVVVAILHCALAVCSSRIPWQPVRFAFCVCVGGWTASYLYFLLHETCHGLLFGPLHPRLNRAYGHIVSLATGLPVYCSLRRSHRDHHKYFTDDAYDLEQQVDEEIRLFDGHPIKRYLWIAWGQALQFYRVMKLGRRPLSAEDILSHLAVLAFDMIALYVHKHVLGYFLLSAFAAFGLGLTGLWGTATHTVYYPEEDTLSYYGWMNRLIVNAGLHVEHHDFPNIPSKFLPELRAMAPEFYHSLHAHDSLCTSFLSFVHNGRYGVHSRGRRLSPKVNPVLPGESSLLQ